jgi:hypothetical protein
MSLLNQTLKLIGVDREARADDARQIEALQSSWLQARSAEIEIDGTHIPSSGLDKELRDSMSAAFKINMEEPSSWISQEEATGLKMAVSRVVSDVRDGRLPNDPKAIRDRVAVDLAVQDQAALELCNRLAAVKPGSIVSPDLQKAVGLTDAGAITTAMTKTDRGDLLSISRGYFTGMDKRILAEATRAAVRVTRTKSEMGLKGPESGIDVRTMSKAAGISAGRG